MTSLISKLALVAALAAAAPAARAHDCDGHETAAYAVPAQLPSGDGSWRGEWRDRGEWSDRDGARRGGGWRGGGWRARELREVRAQLQDLDAARARFYGERPRSRWEAGRFERWYGERRAELERRYDRVQSYAWR